MRRASQKVDFFCFVCPQGRRVVCGRIWHGKRLRGSSPSLSVRRQLRWMSVSRYLTDLRFAIPESSKNPPATGDFFAPQYPYPNRANGSGDRTFSARNRRPGKVPQVLGQIFSAVTVGTANDEDSDNGKGEREDKDAGDEHELLAD